MQAQIKPWGNSQGIRIPKEILSESGIVVGDDVNIKVSNGRIVIEKSFRHKTLEERAAEFNGNLLLDGEFDFGEAVGREVWE